MVLIFVEGAQTLSIYYNDRHLLLSIIWRIKYLFPKPETLRTRLNGWANREPLIIAHFSLFNFFKEEFVH